MSWFQRRARKVRVSFLDLASEIPDGEAGPDAGYTYRWARKDAARVGTRVWAPLDGGPKSAVIIATDSTYSGELRDITRVVSDGEVEDARAAAKEAQEEWFQHVRIAAGLPATPRSKRLSRGAPSIPPLPGRAKQPDADSHARAWWRLHKQAESLNRPADEREAYRQIANEWFAIHRRSAD